MEKNILATLAYTDIFDYPLTEEEFFRWLINQKTDFRRQKTEDRKSFSESLESLLDLNLVKETKGFYHLLNREQIVTLRLEREKYSREKLEICGKAAVILRKIPWIKLIGVTGGLARNNAKKEDDIDLFFITSQNRLWLSRGLVVLILKIIGFYRHPGKITNMICPNMFVAEDNLYVHPEDLYTAHEVCQMRPVFDRGNTYNEFLSANFWVKKFLPNIRQDIKILRYKDIKRKKSISFNALSILVSLYLNFLETFVRDIQIWYMRHRRTTETVSENLIKFHPKDIREKVLAEYQARLKQFDNCHS